jgi:hypothetical protein
MKSHIAAIRAITAEFARQFVQPFLWIGIAVIVIILVLISILAFTISQWWWLAAIPVFLLGCVGGVLWLLIRVILNSLSPKLDTDQKAATKQFTAKLQFAVETLQTPYPLIIFFVIRDIILRRDTGFLSEVAQHSKTLQPDFDALRKLF